MTTTGPKLHFCDICRDFHVAGECQSTAVKAEPTGDFLIEELTDYRETLNRLISLLPPSKRVEARQLAAHMLRLFWMALMFPHSPVDHQLTTVDHRNEQDFRKSDSAQ